MVSDLNQCTFVELAWWYTCFKWHLVMIPLNSCFILEVWAIYNFDDMLFRSMCSSVWFVDIIKVCIDLFYMMYCWIILCKYFTPCASCLACVYILYLCSCYWHNAKLPRYESFFRKGHIVMFSMCNCLSSLYTFYHKNVIHLQKL